LRINAPGFFEIDGCLVHASFGQTLERQCPSLECKDNDPINIHDPVSELRIFRCDEEDIQDNFSTLLKQIFTSAVDQMVIPVATNGIYASFMDQNRIVEQELKLKLKLETEQKIDSNLYPTLALYFNKNRIWKAIKSFQMEYPDMTDAQCLSKLDRDLERLRLNDSSPQL
jgi:hypothetical protein